MVLITTLAQLALRRSCGPSFDRRIARDLLFPLRDIMQILPINRLTGMPLCLSRRASLHRSILSRDALLSVRHGGYCAGVQLTHALQHGVSEYLVIQGIVNSQ